MKSTEAKMRLRFYGAAREVGRSCISVDDRFLFDAGLKISEEGSEYPLDLDPEPVRAVFLSHAHLDHCGALPLLNRQGLGCSVYCNSMTKELSAVLLKDSLKIEMLSTRHPEYKKENIRNIMGMMQAVQYNREYSAGDARFTYFYAGHIPGSASIVLETGGRRVLYTGDINSCDTRLMTGARFENIRDIDIMISEATYGDRSHPTRKGEEERLKKEVRATLSQGGSCLIPAFAVGRAQEILMILADSRWSVPIYLDGMAKKVCNIFQRKPEFIGNSVALAKALKKVRFVKSWRERPEIARQRCIIVTTSGMLDGGPISDYLKYMHMDENSRIFITGFQTEESNGRLLLDTGKVYIDGTRMRVRCGVERFDFSAHSGQKELMELISRLRPGHLVLNHGDPNALEELRKKAESRLKGTKVSIPSVGDTLEI